MHAPLCTAGCTRADQRMPHRPHLWGRCAGGAPGRPGCLLSVPLCAGGCCGCGRCGPSPLLRSSLRRHHMCQTVLQTGLRTASTTCQVSRHKRRDNQVVAVVCARHMDVCMDDLWRCTWCHGIVGRPGPGVCCRRGHVRCRWQHVRQRARSRSRGWHCVGIRVVPQHDLHRCHVVFESRHPVLHALDTVGRICMVIAAHIRFNSREQCCGSMA